jgi:transposase
VGEKTRTDATGKAPSAWDHDPPAKHKLSPLGILVLATGALSLLFGTHETSDFWVDGLTSWWQSVLGQHARVRRLIIYLDNGPNNSGTRTQFLKRLVDFADWSGLTLRLVYYPPYHNKYNPIERCWSALERKWNGVLLNCWQVVLDCALRMTWKSKHPSVQRLEGDYPDGIRVFGRAKKELESRLIRSSTLRKYDITITPRQVT